MKIKEIVSALERFAPTGALLCLDVTEAILDEAIALGYNLVISHHPLIFKGYKSITGKDYVERCMLKAIKNDIVIYSAHTNLDNAQGGVNYKIAEKIGLKHLKVLEPKENSLMKLVTFVPIAQADIVRNALLLPVAVILVTMIHVVTIWKGKGHSVPKKEHILFVERLENFIGKER